MSARRVDGDTGSSEPIRKHTWATVSPRKAGLPVIASYSTAPRAQTSVRPSTSFVERSCSGDMYDGEPMMVAVAVNAGSAPAPSGSTVNLEMPPAV